MQWQKISFECSGQGIDFWLFEECCYFPIDPGFFTFCSQNLMSSPVIILTGLFCSSLFLIFLSNYLS